MALTKEQDEKLDNVLELLENLADLLTERIYENNMAKEARRGIQVEQATHAFMLYRDKCYEAIYALCDIQNK
jgi:hypothetical protein